MVPRAQMFFFFCESANCMLQNGTYALPPPPVLQKFLSRILVRLLVETFGPTLSGTLFLGVSCNSGRLLVDCCGRGFPHLPEFRTKLSWTSLWCSCNRYLGDLEYWVSFRAGRLAPKPWDVRRASGHVRRSFSHSKSYRPHETREQIPRACSRAFFRFCFWWWKRRKRGTTPQSEPATHILQAVPWSAMSYTFVLGYYHPRKGLQVHPRHAVGRQHWRRKQRHGTAR